MDSNSNTIKIITFANDIDGLCLLGIMNINYNIIADCHSQTLLINYLLYIYIECFSIYNFDNSKFDNM